MSRELSSELSGIVWDLEETLKEASTVMVGLDGIFRRATELQKKLKPILEEEDWFNS